jgi:hypothetical protein
MVREFFEETGALVTKWHRFCTLRVAKGKATIHFFAYAWGDCTELKSTTDEEVVWRKVALLGELKQGPVLENLLWLVPMARESLSNPKDALVQSERP